MGCLSSSEQQASTQSEPINIRKIAKLQFETEQPHVELPFEIPTPPIKTDNEVIFLSTTENKTEYIILDLTTRTLTTDVPLEIKCNDKFDVSNTVYTLNTNENKIYFIENNKDIKTLNLSENEIVSLNKSIETTNGT
eukprot:62391_1